MTIDSPYTESGMMVSDVYRTLWRSRFFVLLILGIVVATAFFLTSRQTKMYTAYSLVRVQQTVQRADEVFGVTPDRRAPCPHLRADRGDPFRT